MAQCRLIHKQMTLMNRSFFSKSNTNESEKSFTEQTHSDVRFPKVLLAKYGRKFHWTL